MSALRWKARWISHSQHPDHDLGIFKFRKTLELRTKPNSPYIIKVSADQRYQLRINGEFVCDGPQRGDLTYWHYESIDISPFLKSGANIFEATVWSFGRYAPMAQHTYRLAFVLEGENLNTPQGWEVAQVKDHQFEMLHSELGGFYIDIGPGEIISSPYENLQWKTPNVIVHVLERGEFAGDSPWFLVPRTLPPMKRQVVENRPLLVDRESNDRHPFDTLMIHPGERVLLDYSELLAAYPRFEFEGEVGTTIKASFGEALFGMNGRKDHRGDVKQKSLKGYQDRFILAAKKAVFEPVWWRTWRYIQLETDQPVRLTKVEGIATGYPYEVESSFSADDPWVEKIWEVGVRTAKLCAGETYFDCPYYEQLQYVGDTRIQALIHYYLSRDRRLTRNAVTQFRRSIIPNGLTQSRYPSRVQQIIPPFSLWWILMVFDQMNHDSTWQDLADWSDLSETCQNVCRAFQRILDGNDESYWCFMDWVDGWDMGIPPGAKSDPAIVELFLLAKIAAEYIRLGTSDSKKLDKKFIHSIRDRKPASFRPSEHAQSLSILKDRLMGQHERDWKDESGADLCTYYFQYYKHLAIRPTDYMVALEPWKEMIRQGLTTFAEAPEPTRSDCHAWSAHPLLGFFQIVAGVTSTEKGWTRAKIAPNPGSIREFDAKIAHPNGDLKVIMRSGKFKLESPIPFEFHWKGKSSTFAAGSHEILV